MHYAPRIQQDNAPCNSFFEIFTHSPETRVVINFELPPYSVDLTPIDIDCSLVKRHVSRMSNI